MDQQPKQPNPQPIHNFQPLIVTNSSTYATSQNQFSQNSNSNNQMMPNLQQQGNLYEPQMQLDCIVNFRIQGTKNTLQTDGKIQISDDKYILYFYADESEKLNANQMSKQDSQSILEIQYRVTQTIGTNGNSIIIFINSNKNANEDNDQQQDNPADQVIQLIRNQRKGNFLLRGHCTLALHFVDQQTMQKAYDLISLYVGEEDEGNSQYEQDQGMQEMISADNIDDFGNILLTNNEGSEEEENDSEEDEDMEMQDESQEHH